MLNFTERKQKFWEVVLKNGEHLKAPLPNGIFYEEVAGMCNVKNMQDVEQLVTDILNTNQQGRKFTANEVSDMFDVSELRAIIVDYLVTTEQAISDPN